MTSNTNGVSSQLKAQKIGYIGLGHAGYPLAANLPKAGYHLIVHDADPSVAQKFASSQLNSIAANLNDLKSSVATVDVLITMLPNGKVVRDVLLGEQGIAAGLKDGAIIIDTSSSSPYDTRDLEAALKKLRPTLTLIDSPITQTHLGAVATGDATLMIGCSDAEALEKAMPVLKAISKYTFVMGPVGAGHAMKTLNNYVSVGSIIALCDALVAGQKFGLDPGQMVDVMNVGTARNFSTAWSMRYEGLTKRYGTGYQLGLLIKDVKITEEVMKGVGFDSGFPEMAIRYLEDSAKGLKVGADHTECLKGWERRAGIELKKSDLPNESVYQEKGMSLG